MLPDDWLQFYKDTCAAKHVSAGKSKGRTLRAMWDRSQKLLGSGATRDAGADLQAYHSDMKVVHEFRGQEVHASWTDDELKKRLVV